MKEKSKQTIYENMVNDVESSNLDDTAKKKMFDNILELKDQEVNLMITGATGCGKSSTINALFDMEVAKVGVGVDPETMSISKFNLKNLVLWDSPGLGDGKEKDIKHSKKIIEKLNEIDNKGNSLIDLVLVILDGGSRDLGTSYELINKVIIPNLGENPGKRIIIAINQADVAMKGRYWDYDNNKPERKLAEFLEEKVKSVKLRVKEATGVDIEPIYYSAGYKDDDEDQRPYNLTKLLYFIVKNIPVEKRLAFVDTASKDEDMWKDDDEIIDYNKEIKKSFIESVKATASKGAEIGGDIGSIFGKTGETVGKVVGGVVGAIGGALSSLFRW
ncbi:MAG: hypothetical protein NMA0132 [uncultured Thiotrichaceae bacterium]|uniref:G domain-containing protein n=1 Tax=uncultured Thiotrichaceae bacterium TaxID=298394 RepID=A0A6S6SZL2_9GAMM|nr:MAG: hypothetical protein NMA0132 [uncultured Thiotrichaceae bacterium]